MGTIQWAAGRLNSSTLLTPGQILSRLSGRPEFPRSITLNVSAAIRCMRLRR